MLIICDLPFPVLYLFCGLAHVTLNFITTSVIIPLFFCSSVRSSVGVTVSSSKQNIKFYHTMLLTLDCKLSFSSRIEFFAITKIKVKQ